jgi:hypothetical protein
MRKTLLWTVTLCLAVLASYSNLLSAAAQGKKRITVPAGTRILIRTVDAIDSSKQKTGFRFTATLETNLPGRRQGDRPTRHHRLRTARASLLCRSNVG